MKKPVKSRYTGLPHLIEAAFAADMAKYEAFLAKKAVRNKKARARKSETVAKLMQTVKSSNRSIAYTREEWLMTAVELLRPIFAERGYIIPDMVKATIGFPHVGGRGKRIGECHSPEASKGGFHETFVSPLLEEPTRVLGVLVHELGHAAVGVKHGHRAPFKKFCAALHLEGKPTATTEGEAFKRMVLPILAELGPLPHKALNLSSVKRQKGRNLKVECPCCGLKYRASKQPLLDASAEDGNGRYVHCISPACVQDNPNWPAEALKRQTRIYLEIEAEDSDEEE